MIVPKCQIRHRPDRNRIIDDNGALLDVADAEDRHLRLVDDRHAEERAEHAWIGDREGAAGYFVGLQLLGAGSVRQIGDRPREAEQVPLVGVFHHRHDQSPVQRDRDADVDVLVKDHLVAID